MNRHLLHGLLALYPRAFQDRYGTELARLTDELVSAGEITPLLAVLNLAGGAALEWGRVLTSSRRAALTVAAAAVTAAAGSLILAVAGISFVTGHARPSTAASVPGARVVIAQPAGACAVTVNPAGPGALRITTWANGAVQITAGTNAAVQLGRTAKVPVLVPAQLSPAGPCVMWFSTDSVSGVTVVGSGFATPRNLTVGSVLTIAGVKFRVIGIIDQSQASNPLDADVPMKVVQLLLLPSGSPEK